MDSWFQAPLVGEPQPAEDRLEIHILEHIEGKEDMNTGAWELVEKTKQNKNIQQKEKEKVNKRKRKGANKRKGLPSQADIPTQLAMPTQYHLTALQAIEATPTH